MNMRRAVSSDTEEIVQFCEDCFGENYTFVPEMRGFIEDEENRLFVMEDDGRIIAAVLYLKDDKRSVMEDMEVEEADFDRISGGKPVLHHKFCIVRNDYRGRGLMTELMEKALAELERENVYGAVFGQAWIRQEEMPMENICARTGYHPYKRQISPWWKYADRTCNICKGRCKCDAMVYYRKL
ncbi:MAG: GNAT family N-acetyltransferase [Lachnospiraceae bacterium]|nr:GNAT family N-acetyltransferase [Lachnospiraceae bacterium]